MEENKKFKNKNLIEASKNAFSGIVYTMKTQRNIRIQSIIAIIVIILGIILKLQIIEIVCVFFSIFLVIFAEMINTAVETTVDLYTNEYSEKAKIAKDVAAGAVVVTAINSITIGALIFPVKIFSLFF